MADSYENLATDLELMGVELSGSETKEELWNLLEDYL